MSKSRFEVVRTNADQPWHARMIINGRISWRTENYVRMVGAERAILSFLRATTNRVIVDWSTPSALRWNVPGVEKVVTNHAGSMLGGLPLVGYVDERTEQSGLPLDPLDLVGR